MAASKKKNSTKGLNLDMVLKTIEKDFGPGTIMTGGIKIPEVERVSSGIPSLDEAIGGGYPIGRIIELFGASSSGKTTTALHAVASFQKANKKVAYIDVEHAFDPEYAERIGVDVENLLFSQPQSGEDAINITELLIKSGEVGLVVIDSVANLVPTKELEENIEDNQMGLQARMMAKAMRKLTGAVHETNTVLMFINQMRASMAMFGSSKTVAGGNALGYYASVRIELAVIGGKTEGAGGLRIANDVKAKVVKNKTFPPYRQAIFRMTFGNGVDIMHEYLTAAIEKGFIEKRGAWFACEGTTFAQGEENAKQYMRDNPDFFNKVIDAIRPQVEENQDEDKDKDRETKTTSDDSP